jgi:maltose alpha-D-glucosyltransferase/alpha-amylase
VRIFISKLFRDFSLEKEMSTNLPFPSILRSVFLFSVVLATTTRCVASRSYAPGIGHSIDSSGNNEFINFKRLEPSEGHDVWDALCNNVENRFWVLRSWTDCATYEYVRSQAEIWNGYAMDQVTLDLFWIAQQVRERTSSRSTNDAQIPKDWYKQPFYYLYVQYFGTPDDGNEGNFSTLAEMLPYLSELGIKNLYLLPHYESPLGDNGYDVSDYRAAERLGGELGFREFMGEAQKMGFRVVTDAVYNHTSVEHRWFKAALTGDERFLNYYLRVNDWTVLNPKGYQKEDGTWYMKYSTPRGILERLVVFPDVEKKHFLEAQIGPSENSNRIEKFYREFYPFQVDLNLQNPEVINEIFQITANEFLSGTLGKRNDAILWWVKPPDEDAATHNKQTYALHKILKVFIKSLNEKGIMIPEAVDAAANTRALIGDEVKINGRDTVDQGDVMFNFELQNALRESLYLQSSEALNAYLSRNQALYHGTPDSAVWLNLLGHHDEMYLGFVQPKSRDAFQNYVQEECKGSLYKAGLSAGGRYANCLGGNSDRRALALSLLYAMPGVPSIYYGDEIGAESQPDHARLRSRSQAQVLQELGVNVTEENAFDPRELHRGPVKKSEFMGAVERSDPGVLLVKAFSRLWNSAISSNLSATFVHEDQPALFVTKKYARDSSSKPVLWVANLSKDAIKARVHSHAFVHIIQNGLVKCLLRSSPFRETSTVETVTLQDNFYSIDLPAFGFVVFTAPDSDSVEDSGGG